MESDIVLISDGSTLSRHAHEATASLAAALGCAVRLVFPWRYDADSLGLFEPSLERKRAGEMMRNILDRWRETHPEVAAEVSLEAGSVGVVAARLGAQCRMLVMPRHLAQASPGSARDLFDIVVCPVLIA
jgi:hypothetical protein